MIQMPDATPMKEREYKHFRNAILNCEHSNWSCETQFMKRLIAMIDEMEEDAHDRALEAREERPGS